MRIILIHVWIGFLCSPFLIAQKENKLFEPNSRVAWFVYTSMPEGIDNPVTIMSGKEITQVTLSKRSPSMPVKISADGILKLVRKIENSDDPEKLNYQILAQVLVPKEVNKALIILIPATKNPSGIVFQSRVKDLSLFNGGNSMYLNMTKLKVGVELGTTKMAIEPGQDKIHSDPNLSEPTNLVVRYSYYHTEKMEWKILSASTIVLYPTRREICIFSWDERFKRIDYHGMTLPVM